MNKKPQTKPQRSTVHEQLRGKNRRFEDSRRKREANRRRCELREQLR